MVVISALMTSSYFKLLLNLIAFVFDIASMMPSFKNKDKGMYLANITDIFILK